MPDSPEVDPWGELNRLVPCLFVLTTIGGLYSIYVFGHCVPLLHRIDDDDAVLRGMVELVIFNVITFFLFVSYTRCTLIHPGEVPQEWVYIPGQEGTVILPTVEVKKKGGVPRHCKKCGKYKPDRCHHCRVCGMCILKMDHHCPWINNCVGHHNYKFFLLLLFYTMLDAHMILWTSSESMVTAVSQDASFIHLFLLLFSLTISFFLAAAVTLFLGFHIWLVVSGLSTIEFCEQVLPHANAAYCWCFVETDSMWNVGWYRNLQNVLGESPFTWLLPVATTVGDGLSYEHRLPQRPPMPIPMPRDFETMRGPKGSSKKLQAPVSYGTMGAFEPNMPGHYQRQPYCVPGSGGDASKIV